MHNIKIKTERLLLRPLTIVDANAVFEWASDERVSRYMVYATYTSIEQAKEWLAFVEKDFIKAMISQFYENNMDMVEYLCCDAHNIATQIHTTVQHEKLSKIFVL